MLTILKFGAKVSISIDFVNYFGIYFKLKSHLISKMAILVFSGSLIFQFLTLKTETENEY